MAGAKPPCPVCRSVTTSSFLEVDGRSYRKCETCEARYLHPEFYLSSDEEHAHYLHHENDTEDAGYRKFLSRLADPMLAKLPANSKGLDYGCGPGPALAHMFMEADHEVAIYDPFFAPDPQPLEQTYDFITCTETAEHFRAPANEFDRIGEMLRPGGWLGVMTCFQTDDARFANWHYRKDPTHVVFYREATFHVIAGQRGWKMECPRKDVVLFHKPLTSS